MSFPSHDVGLCTATIALFTELTIVMDMISLGTLLVFYLVANALIYRKYVMISHNPPSHTFLYLFLLSSCAIGFSISWKLKLQLWSLLLLGGSMIIITALFHYMVPCLRQDTQWSVPFMPWPAAMSVFLNVFLMTTLKALAFQRFGIWACLITLFYVLYGVHSTYQGEEFEMGVNEVNPNSLTLQPKVDIQVAWLKKRKEKERRLNNLSSVNFQHFFFFSLFNFFEAVFYGISLKHDGNPIKQTHDEYIKSDQWKEWHEREIFPLVILLGCNFFSSIYNSDATII